MTFEYQYVWNLLSKLFLLKYGVLYYISIYLENIETNGQVGITFIKILGTHEQSCQKPQKHVN